MSSGPGSRSCSRSATEVDARSSGVDFVPPRRRLQPQRVPAHRPARPRQARPTFVTRLRADRGRALRRLRARGADARRASAAECTAGVHGGRARCRGAHRRSSSGSRAQRARGLRPRSRPPRACPTSTRPLAPTTPYGRTASRSRRSRPDLGRRHGIPVAALRHGARCRARTSPSPLGRLLRLPAVPVPALADPPFQLLHHDDAARAMVEALVRGADGAVQRRRARARRARGRPCGSADASRCRSFGPGWLVATARRRARRRAGAAARARADHARAAPPTAPRRSRSSGSRDLRPDPGGRAPSSTSGRASRRCARRSRSRRPRMSERRAMSADGRRRVARRCPNYGDRRRPAARVRLDSSTRLRRRFDGRYAGRRVRRRPAAPGPRARARSSTASACEVDARRAAPAAGPALLVANRGLGVVEPARALGARVRQEAGRRLRDRRRARRPVRRRRSRASSARIGSYAGDLAAVLRAGHLAARAARPTLAARPAPATPPLAAARGHARASRSSRSRSAPAVRSGSVRPGGPWVVSGAGEPLGDPPRGQPSAASDPLAGAPSSSEQCPVRRGLGESRREHPARGSRAR